MSTFTGLKCKWCATVKEASATVGWLSLKLDERSRDWVLDPGGRQRELRPLLGIEDYCSPDCARNALDLAIAKLAGREKED